MESGLHVSGYCPTQAVGRRVILVVSLEVESHHFSSNKDLGTQGWLGAFDWIACHESD